MEKETNPLLQEWSGPYGGVPDFTKYKIADFKPAIEFAIQEKLEEIDSKLEEILSEIEDQEYSTPKKVQHVSRDQIASPGRRFSPPRRDFPQSSPNISPPRASPRISPRSSPAKPLSQNSKTEYEDPYPFHNNDNSRDWESIEVINLFAGVERFSSSNGNVPISVFHKILVGYNFKPFRTAENLQQKYNQFRNIMRV